VVMPVRYSGASNLKSQPRQLPRFSHGLSFQANATPCHLTLYSLDISTIVNFACFVLKCAETVWAITLHEICCCNEKYVNCIIIQSPLGNCFSMIVCTFSKANIFYEIVF
jgi:hypothetical protein